METGKTRDRQNQVTVDLQGLNAPWLEWCKSRRLTPSDAMRRTIAKVLDKTPPAPLSVMLPVIERPVARHDIALTESEEARVVALAQTDGLSVTKWIVALKEIATGEGMSLARWLQALVRVSVTGQSEFDGVEFATLTRSNQLLPAIGSNLNQIARQMKFLGNNVNQIAKQMNERPGSDEITLAQLDYVLQEIWEHKRLVFDLVNSNSSRCRS